LHFALKLILSSEEVHSAHRPPIQPSVPSDPC